MEDFHESGRNQIGLDLFQLEETSMEESSTFMEDLSNFMEDLSRFMEEQSKYVYLGVNRNI